MSETSSGKNAPDGVAPERALPMMDISISAVTLKQQFS